MEYIKLFQAHEEYDAFLSGGTMLRPNVSHCIEEKHVHYKSRLKDKPLTFIALDNCTFSFSQNDLDYSLDNGKTWETLSSGTSTPTIKYGNRISWKCENPIIEEMNGIGRFSSTGKFAAEGNIMSLLYGDDFADKDDLTGKDFVFRTLFRYSNIVTADRLILPAMTLSASCYRTMFAECPELITPPEELPALEVAETCYAIMFRLSTKLKKAPKILAEKLASQCCIHMFYGCSSLVEVPDILPAMEIAPGCYEGMFSGCTSLTAAPQLPALEFSGASRCYCCMFGDCHSLTDVPDLLCEGMLPGSAYRWMFSNCKSLSKAPKILATGVNYCSMQHMFENCVSLVTAPEIHVTATTGNYGLGFMFDGCTNLKNVQRALPPIENINLNTYYNMFQYCTSLEKAPILPIEDVGTANPYHMMFYMCSKLKWVACYRKSGSDSATNWLNGVSPTGTIWVYRDTTYPSGISGIPNGWTVKYIGEDGDPLNNGDE